MKLALKRFLIFSVLAVSGLYVGIGSVCSREFEGVLDNVPIRLQSEELQFGEYFRAVNLVTFFPNRWEYDALSGTLRVVRRDGVRVGVKVGDGRVLVGGRVFPTGKPLIRHQGRVFIPFHVVVDYLLPEAKLRLTGSPSQEPTRESLVRPTATPFVLSRPTSPFQYVRPTPTIVFPNHYEDLIVTPTPTPFVSFEPTPVQAAPRAIIVIDPGVTQNAYQQNVLSGAREEDITLGVSNKLTSLLRVSPNIEVLLTQQNSSQEPLTTERRVGVANQNDADLFISIQCGGLFTESLSEAVVFYMNPVMDAAELQSIESKPSFGSSPRWDDAYRANVSESVRLARAVNVRLQDFYARANIISIGSEPRPSRMAVLRGLTVPAILIELGNLSHRDTAQYLTRPLVQEELADELYQAINDFLYERTGYSMPIQTER